NFSEIETLGSVPFGLSVTNTDGQLTAVPGRPVTYTVVVSNTGTLGVSGVSFTDVFSGGLTNVSWSAVFSQGSSGNAFGTGNIGDTLTLPPGATVTYTVTATTSAGAGGTLTDTVTATVGAGTTDPNPSNNTATDSVSVVAISADVQVAITTNSGTVGTNLS